MHEVWQELIERIQSWSTWNEVVLDPRLTGMVAGKMHWAFQVWHAKQMEVPIMNLMHPGYLWQARWELFLVHTDPDDRAVHYVYDPGGGHHVVVGS